MVRDVVSNNIAISVWNAILVIAFGEDSTVGGPWALAGKPLPTGAFDAELRKRVQCLPEAEWPMLDESDTSCFEVGPNYSNANDIINALTWSHFKEESAAGAAGIAGITLARPYLSLCLPEADTSLADGVGLANLNTMIKCAFLQEDSRGYTGSGLSLTTVDSTTDDVLAVSFAAFIGGGQWPVAIHRHLRSVAERMLDFHDASAYTKAMHNGETAVTKAAWSRRFHVALASSYFFPQLHLILSRALPSDVPTLFGALRAAQASTETRALLDTERIDHESAASLDIWIANR